MSSFSKIRTLLTRASSLMPRIRQTLKFSFQGSRLKPPKMSRFTPSIWRITTSNSPLMTRHACCQSLSTIIWMEIPFCRSRWRPGTYDRWILICRKLTFEEPYQAIKFASKKDCYKYLTTKYKDYTGPGLAKPFIMDNGKWVDMD